MSLLMPKPDLGGLGSTVRHADVDFLRRRGPSAPLAAPRHVTGRAPLLAAPSFDDDFDFDVNSLLALTKMRPELVMDNAISHLTIAPPLGPKTRPAHRVGGFKVNSMIRRTML
jgi:hypothetical protein